MMGKARYAAVRVAEWAGWLNIVDDRIVADYLNFRSGPNLIDSELCAPVATPEAKKIALVETRDLVKRFGSLTAVDHISFSVERGEVVGFLGPNGAGKSTAMKFISGFMEPTSAQASIAGH